MKLTTIWSPGLGMDFQERMARTKDCVAAGIARHLPVRVRYHATLQGIGKATMKAPEVPAANVSYILDHMETPRGVR